MRRIIAVLPVLFLLIAGTGCTKDNGCQDKTVASETAAMNAFATTNGITTTAHSSGVLYEITTVGTGASPTIAQTVSIRYTGKYMDGTVFDSQTGSPVSLVVGGTIPGFQIALQLLKKGGKIKVIIPSSWAYGCAGRGSVPGNAILYFEIELVDIL